MSMSEYSILGRPENHYGEVRHYPNEKALLEEYLNTEEMKNISNNMQYVPRVKGELVSPLEGAKAAKEMGDYAVLEKRFRQAGIPQEIIRWAKHNSIPPNVVAEKVAEMLSARE